MARHDPCLEPPAVLGGDRVGIPGALDEVGIARAARDDDAGHGARAEGARLRSRSQIDPGGRAAEPAVWRSGLGCRLLRRRGRLCRVRIFGRRTRRGIDRRRRRPPLLDRGRPAARDRHRDRDEEGGRNGTRHGA
ncbi:MAG: hypothetical protein D6705_11220 [Deltaproteobacteria bacterium]|nr:MAG: hypothetical protein D6705_11220 [Deltaproteobacteria bacterium]